MRVLRELTLFALLLAFWLLLSGQYNPLFIGMGVVSAAVVTWASVGMLEGTVGSAQTHPRVSILRLLRYIVWLGGRIVPSAVMVARIVLDPRLPPRPGIVRFRTRLSSPAARTMLANSITLVPGTMTLDVEGDLFTVHTFTPEAMEDLSDAHMQNRIAAIFREPPEPPPTLLWESGHTPERMEQQP